MLRQGDCGFEVSKKGKEKTRQEKERNEKQN
jgi:hypothetical protein